MIPWLGELADCYIWYGGLFYICAGKQLSVLRALRFIPRPHLFVHSEAEVLRAFILEGSLLSTLFGCPSYTVADFLLFVNGRAPRCVWALQYLSFSFAW
jgi:hypothetical protein